MFIGQIVMYHIVINEWRNDNMFTIRYVRGHVQVYDWNGKFLFSADTEREAREELIEYEECAD